LDNLFFYYNLPINIDASLSYDESLIADSSMNNDPLLKFKWICPDKIQSICDGIADNVLKLEPQSFISLQESVLSNAQSSLFTFGLILSKKSRMNSTNFSVTISKEIKNNSDLLIITPSSLGLKNEDILFCSKFLDESINTKSFSYLWTVGEIDSTFNNYKNGRNQNCLLISPLNLNIGKNLITLQVITSTSVLTKTYVFTRSQPPSGGSCSVTATNVGITLVTNYTFSSEKWETKNPPLLYKYLYYNNLNVSIDITSYTVSSIYNSVKISPGDKFYVSVMDQSGMFTNALCKYSQVNQTVTTSNSSATDFLIQNSTSKVVVISTL